MTLQICTHMSRLHQKIICKKVNDCTHRPKFQTLPLMLVAVVILLIDYLTQRCCCSKSGNKISKLIFFWHQICHGFWREASTFFFVLISFLLFLVSARDFSRWTYSKSIGGCSVFSGLNRLNFFREIQFWWGIELLARTVVVKIATKMPKMTWAVPFCPYCSWDQPEKLVQWAFPL